MRPWNKANKDDHQYVLDAFQDLTREDVPTEKGVMGMESAREQKPVSPQPLAESWVGNFVSS